MGPDHSDPPPGHAPGMTICALFLLELVSKSFLHELFSEQHTSVYAKWLSFLQNAVNSMFYTQLPVISTFVGTILITIHTTMSRFTGP